jgi:SAM-dependent methyltransferase
MESSTWSADAVGHAGAHGGRAPWETGRPQPAIQALADAGRITGRVLDAGCGSGEHTLLAARLGLDAVGVDLDGPAVDAARDKARVSGLSARFLRRDARRLADVAAEVGAPFDTVIDSELFHLLEPLDRTAYVAGLGTVLRPGGHLFVLCYSDGQPDVPHQVRREDLVTAFAEGWRIEAIDPVRIATTVHPDGAHGWLATIVRLGPEWVTAQARVRTRRAGRYLVQLCEHLRQLPAERHFALRPRQVEWTADRGSITFEQGTGTLIASDDALTVRLDAADADTLRRMQEMFAHRLETIGRRDDLIVQW